MNRWCRSAMALLMVAWSTRRRPRRDARSASWLTITTAMITWTSCGLPSRLWPCWRSRPAWALEEVLVMPEHEVRLEAEQDAEVMIKGHLDLLLGGDELIEGAGTRPRAAEVDPDSLVLGAIGNEPVAPAIAEEVGLQRAGQAMFAGGRMSHRRRGRTPVGERHALGLTDRRVRMVESPSGRKARTARTGPEVEASGCRGLRPRWRRSVPAGTRWSWVGPDERSCGRGRRGAPLDLAVVAIGLDDADILVDRAAGGRTSMVLRTCHEHDDGRMEIEQKSGRCHERTRTLSYALPEDRSKDREKTRKTKPNLSVG